MFIRRIGLAALCAALSLTLAACGGTSSKVNAPAGGGSDGQTGPTGRVFHVTPGDAATGEMVAAMVQAAPGDTIEFACGYFELSSSLQLTNTEDVLVKGCGRDKTVLSFKNNNAPEGILAVNVQGLTVQDLTVLDTGGNGIELRGVDHGTLQRVRAIWSSGGGRASATPINASNVFANDARLLNVPCTDPATQDPDDPQNILGDTHSPDYTVSKLSGRYGIYPVSSENILIDDAISIGASDAGIYVGQTNTAIIRNSLSRFNVFGFEIENVRGGEYDGNTAECNTGGFLIYDLDNLRQYGDRSVMKNNISRMNNTYNFTSGGFVGNVPAGSGMITLAYDRIDIHDNVFEDNNTAGIIHTSYEIFPEGAGRPNEHRIDWYTEGLHIWHNTFKNNGNQLPLPTVKDLTGGQVSKLLPAVVGLKNQAGCLLPQNLLKCPAPLLQISPTALLNIRGAHILWDGLLDVNDADCPYPKDANGQDVPRDDRGKPILNNEVPDPSCHYNQYKFDQTKADKPRIVPDWYSCIDDDNTFSNDSITYANFHGTKGLELIVSSSLDPAAIAQFPSSFDMSSHKCVEKYGKNLPQLPDVVIPPFHRSGDYDPAPTAEQIAKLCGANLKKGEVNFSASKVNCPTLDQYNLFADPQDPTSAPNGGGVPYSLNTKLFSDYAVKYRVAYLPEGTKAVYRDAKTDGTNAVIVFPSGTIIAKTFSFRDEANDTETPVETRLIIKRVNNKGVARWDGITYIWSTENGKHVARLSLEGATASVHWQTTDVDSGAVHTGSTDSYLIPNANQCLSCHSRADQEAGSAPIGLRIRNMNGAYRTESSRVSEQGKHQVAGVNQIEYWCSHGLMIGCPSDLGVDPATQIATKIERVPTFNKPGDAGFPAGSDQDVEARARSWVEANCQHCHNVSGFAASTGFYLDSLRKVDTTYGVCKRPTATGEEGNGGRRYDIHPADAADSIMEFRIGPTATTPAARMPPLARSVVDEEGHALIQQWIQNVVHADETAYPGSTSCAR